MHWNLMNDEEFGTRKLLKLKYRKGDQIIETFCKIGSPPKIRSPLVHYWKVQESEKSTPDSWRNHWNLMNDQEFQSVELLRLKYRRGRNNWDFLQNCFGPEIRYPLFNLQKFLDSEKSTPHLCRNDWNLINDEEFGSRKLLKLKYRRGEQIIQTFCKIGSP